MLTLTAEQRFNDLNNHRQGLLDRCRRYAKLTILRAHPDPTEDTKATTVDQSHGVQSVGAQAVNHIVNRLLLTLFAPSRPFFRLSPSGEVLNQARSLNLPEAKISEMLALAEKEAVQVMDRRSMRPQLFDGLLRLVVTGNVLMDTSDEERLRMIGLEDYVVKRSINGAVNEVVIRECVHFDQLIDPVQEAVKAAAYEDRREFKPEDSVTHYKWLKREGKHFTMTQWVDGYHLDDRSMNGKWPVAQCPYRPLTWYLTDKQDYGTGHVEDYAADLAALSIVSRSILDAAILSSEYRWVLHPTGLMSVEDFVNVPNGGAIPGARDDVSLLQANVGRAIQEAMAVAQEYIRRIGAGFLLNSAMTRDAERVTAEEIRLQAQELETALGGAYTRLAVELQLPLAAYLLSAIEVQGIGTQLEPLIVTGLDALSRNGDLENLKLWLADLAAVSALPEMLQRRLKLDAIAAALASGRGLQTSEFMLSEEEMAQAMAAPQSIGAPGASLEGEPPA